MKTKIKSYLPALALAAVITVAVPFMRPAQAQSDIRQSHGAIVGFVYDPDGTPAFFDVSSGGSAPAITNGTPAGPAIAMLLNQGFVIQHIEGVSYVLIK